MRTAQKQYFKTRDNMSFRAARALENDVDREVSSLLQVAKVLEFQLQHQSFQ